MLHLGTLDNIKRDSDFFYLACQTAKCSCIVKSGVSLRNLWGHMSLLTQTLGDIRDNFRILQKILQILRDINVSLNEGLWVISQKKGDQVSHF